MSATAILDDGQHITFDGYDGIDLVCKRINLWRDYDNRGKGARCSVRHGYPGELLERKGDACKVRVVWEGRSQEGWVTYWFIKELKVEWQLKRLMEATA